MSLNMNPNQMTEESRQRRREKDHERYIAHREERQEKQRAYYAANRERCIASVRSSEIKKIVNDLWKKRNCTS